MLNAVVVTECVPASVEDILSPTALLFLADLARAFRARIEKIRTAPSARESGAVGSSRSRQRDDARDWACAPVPSLLRRPRVDLVGPADTASIVSALSSHATAFVADMDDTMLPSWRKLLDGQALLRNLIRRVRRHEHPAHASMPPVILRPRTNDVDEEHVFVDGERLPAGLVDVGLFCFHNAAALVERNEGPWLSLTKLRGRADARLWRDIADWLEQRLALRPRSIRFSLRIDTIDALDQLDEMLSVLHARMLSVVCGRFDLVRDVIASRERIDAEVVTPPRSFLTVDRAPLSDASARIVTICRRRGVQALGPMLTFFGASRSTYARAYANTLRQARLGFDGTQLVEPKLVPIANAALAAAMRSEEGARMDRRSPYERPSPSLTESGVRENIEIVLVQLSGAFSGQARVRIDSTLEDLASARAARAQLWEWIRARAVLSERPSSPPSSPDVLDRTRFVELVREESDRLGSPPYVSGLLQHICAADSCEELGRREDQLRRDMASAQQWEAR